MIKKLALYCYDCIREEFKSSSFRNLESDKKNIIYETLETTFKNDNENILEIMTKYQLNKSDRALIYGEMFLTGKIKLTLSSFKSSMLVNFFKLLSK